MQHLPQRRIFTRLAAWGSLAFFAQQAQAQSASPSSKSPMPPIPPGGSGAGDAQQWSERRIERLLQAVGGTPEQKTKLTQLASSAMQDMQPLREQHRAARKKGMALLAAPTIDRSALEQLRAQQMGLADSMSKRLLQHLADAADVLTPAQRTKLAERMAQRHSRGEGRIGQSGHGGRGGHGGHRDHAGPMGGVGGWFR